MVTNILIASGLVALLFPLLACLALRWLLDKEVIDAPCELEPEQTQRGSAKSCHNCNKACFEKDWVCLCLCHDGRVPLHKVHDRRRALQALERLKGEE